MAPSSEEPAPNDVALEEIVFSCTICQATPLEVYATKQSNQGFHSGSGDDDGVVIKLWIAECAHVFCGKHLAGGAAPFHPKDVAPRAPCPHCQRHRGDDSAKELYAIRGLHDGEYDAIIPQQWLHCPAIKLDGAEPGMDAVRFQYNALALYALHVRKHWVGAQQKHQAMETAYSEECKQRRQGQSEAHDLKARIDDLVKSDARLRKWEARKPLINHYLSVVNDMAEDIEIMRAKLAELGFSVEQRSYAFDQDKEDLSRKETPALNQNVRKPDVSRDVEQSSSSRKRKHEVYNADAYEDHVPKVPKARGSSRDLMPPPLPKFRLPLRIAHTATQPTSNRLPRQSPSSGHPVGIYVDHCAQQAANPDRPRVASPPERGEFHYATAGNRSLPLRPLPRGATQPQGVQDGQTQTRILTHHFDAAGAFGRQPPAQVSVSAGRLQQHNHYPPVEHYDVNRQPTYNSRPRQAQRIAHYDADNGTVDQQMDDQARIPLQPFSQSWVNEQRPMGSRARDLHATPSPHRMRQPPVAPGASPFFRQDIGGSRPITTQPAQSRNHQIRQQQSSITRRLDVPHAINRAHVDLANEYSELPTPRGLPLIAPSHRLHQEQHLYRAPTARLDTLGYVQRGLAVPQTPRNPNGLFERPDRLQSSASAHHRPPSTMQRGRVSLLPNQQPIGYTANCQERTLHQLPGVRGVRGLSSQGFPISNHHDQPVYDAPNDLFSSAGGRRRVRR